jgi:hypothetical protein
MFSFSSSRRGNRSNVQRAALVVLLAAAAAGAARAEDLAEADATSVQALRQVPPARDAPTAPAPVARLEEAFWRCDYSIARQTMNGEMGAVCSAVIEGVRSARFGGDMEKLLRWREQNQPAQHRRLRAAEEEYPLP